MIEFEARALARRIVELRFPSAKLRSARILTGGVSARIIAFELEDVHGISHLVARFYGQTDATGNSRIASLEAVILQVMSGYDIPVPKPVTQIPAGIVGKGPCLVTTFEPGAPREAPANNACVATQCGRMMYRIHQVPCPQELSRLLQPARFRPVRWTWQWRELGVSDDAFNALEMFTGRFKLGVGAMPGCIHHGDFWPGNILWNDGAISSVVDWEDASFGDPRFDMAVAMVELAVSRGTDVARMFLGAYEEQAGIALGVMGPFLLDSILRLEPKIGTFGLSPPEEGRMRNNLVAFAHYAS